MNILFNTTSLQTSCRTLEDFLTEQKLPTTGIAVAVSGKIVPRKNWQNFELSEGMNIVVIKAVCGG